MGGGGGGCFACALSCEGLGVGVGVGMWRRAAPRGGCDAFLGLQCHLLSPRPGAGDPTGSLGTPALGTRQGETSISASLHSILRIGAEFLGKKSS